MSSIECLVRDVLLSNGPVANNLVANGPLANGLFDRHLSGLEHDEDLGEEVMVKELVPVKDIDFGPEIRN